MAKAPLGCPSHSEEEPLMGIDLVNGFTYLGKSSSRFGDNVYILHDYVVLPTSDLGNIEDRYRSKDRSATSPGIVRIDADKGLAIRIGRPGFN